MATLYETLGVCEDASDDEIKRAYRKAAMRAHPDRNQGREAAAHEAFQEIKEAYSILSDPDQRRVYDAVFAEEMGKAHRREAQAARERAQRAERQAQAERDRYEKYVAQAMRYAERGHNRDTVFGVLLGRGCDEALAARIADGVAAFSASRVQAPAAEREQPDAPAGGTVADRQARKERPLNQGSADRPDPFGPSEPSDGAAHAGLFSSLWHGIFGVRP